jgi:hypothetical protein
MQHLPSFQRLIISDKLFQFPLALFAGLEGFLRGGYFSKVLKVVRNGIPTENGRPVVKVVDFVEVGELLCGEELAFEGEEESFGLLGDLVSQVEIAGIRQTGL